jgi:hypothetical protein
VRRRRWRRAGAAQASGGSAARPASVTWTRRE